MNISKKLSLSVFILMICALTINTQAQKLVAPKQTAANEYKASMDGWYVDINEAYAESARTGKPILANFTGTDWCGWCIRLKKQVFLTPQFKEWAKNNVVLLELDFPRRFQLPENIKQQNASLQQAFGVRGYPTIWVFDVIADPQTKQNQLRGLAKTGYVAGGPAAFIKDLENKLAATKAQLNKQ